jgi:hypothetical protein
MRMPFGKYKGQDITALPDEYLLWLLANIALRDPLLSAVEEAVDARGLKLPPLPPPRTAKRPPTRDEDGAWTVGGDPQEVIRGDFPLSARKR